MDKDTKHRQTDKYEGRHATRKAAPAPSAKSASNAKHSSARKKRRKRSQFTPAMIGAAASLVLTLLVVGIWKFSAPREDAQIPAPVPEATQEVWQAPETRPPLTDTPEPENMATMAATEVPEPKQIDWQPQAMETIAESADPNSEAYGYEQLIVISDALVENYERETPIAMKQGKDYTELEGILTFRGNNYRDTAAYGAVPDNASKLSIVWSKNIGEIDGWTGVGWTGQPSIVRWPEELRNKMNIHPQKKSKDGLCEVIYGTLDGHIYFLDLDDGQETRSPITLPASIKGSVSVDPRGIPLLYSGQGIDEVHGKKVPIGTYIFSLIDQKCLFFLDGRDEYALRKWYAFDCSPLIDAASDTMIHVGENGIVYTIQLNTRYDVQTGELSINPDVERVLYKSKVSTRPGMENSPSVYDHYAYYTDNSGLLVCMDLNTLEPAWMGDVGDDSDASIVLEEDDAGVWLYTVCELDHNGLQGNAYCRKYNALTGEEMWKIAVPCKRYKDGVEAGGFATPAIGKGSLSELVYFHITRTEEGARLGAVDKASGKVVWQIRTGTNSWSSPVCVYDDTGRGYILFCNSNGFLCLCDGLTGEVLTHVELGDNIEGSPAVFGDMLVIGTRGKKIFGVRIEA